MRPVAAVAAGGAVGALLRWWLGETFPAGAGFPWTTCAINLVGSALLAALPALDVVRRHPALAAGLGSGVLGGFTTLSACAEESRALYAAGDHVLAGAYVLGTLAACLVAVTAVSHLVPVREQRQFERERGDE